MFDVSVTLFSRSGPLLFMLYQIAYLVCRHQKLPLSGNRALINPLVSIITFFLLNKYESKYLVGGLKVLEKF